MKNFLFTALGGVLALVVFVLGSLFGEFVNTIKGGSNAQNLEINEQIEFSLKSTPDLYKANPSFYATNLSDSDKSIINARFTGILALVKENGLCSGGSYQTHIEPRPPMSDAQNEPVKLSLRSQLNCSFRANELDKYNELISGLENLINASPVKLHISAIVPTFSDALSARNDAELKSGLIKEAANTAKSLSEGFGKVCELKDISFNGGGYRVANAMMMDAGAKIAAPEQKEQKLSASASARYICK